MHYGLPAVCINGDMKNIITFFNGSSSQYDLRCSYSRNKNEKSVVVINFCNVCSNLENSY